MRGNTKTQSSKRKAVELDQKFYNGHAYLGMSYQMKGLFSEATSEYQKARDLDDDPIVWGFLGNAYAASGKREEALKLVSQMKEIANRRYVHAYSFAIVYAGLADKDQTFQWLEKSFQDRNSDIIALNVDPLFDNVRSDPRFADLVRRIGL
jgi:adenylate cyclase